MSDNCHPKKFLLTLLVTLISFNAGSLNLLEQASAKSTSKNTSNSAVATKSSKTTVTTKSSKATVAPKGQNKTQKSYSSRHKKYHSKTSSKATKTKIKVFFPKNPKSEEDFTKVTPVFRQTNSNNNLSKFAIEQLIAGPTMMEKIQGLRGTIKLTGNSNCGSDFSLAINQQVARLQFCKTLISGGVGDVARTKSSINATLRQFSTVKSVVILDKNGNCWGDESGENLCLRT